MSLCFSRRCVPLMHETFKLNNFLSRCTSKHFDNKPNNSVHPSITLNLKGVGSIRTLTTTSYAGYRNRKSRTEFKFKENTRLTEVITIYEKLTKSKSRGVADVFRYPDETKTIETTASPPNDAVVDDSAKILDFSKFRDISNQNYTYFSAATGLIQASALHTLQWKYSSSKPLETSSYSDLIFNSKNFCLGIVNPTEEDLAQLQSHFRIHDLTMRDIREQNTEEKVEVFKHYTFVSLKVYSEAGENQMDLLTRGRKEDLNILMFPDSEVAIILHYGAPWAGFKDLLGFLNLLTNYGRTNLTPDWVFFSTIIELTQDAKFCTQHLEPKILTLNVAVHATSPSHVATGSNRNTTDLSEALNANFNNEFEIYKINRFIRPKIRVLKELELKGNARFSPKVLELLAGTRKDMEDIGDVLDNFKHILERSQDTCLTLANIRQSTEANEMGRMMKRLSEVALLFLPLQAIAGLLGMNVKIPFQSLDSTVPFWGIMAASSALVIVIYRMNIRFSKSK